MITIILFLVVGSILAYISQSNMMPVTVSLGAYVLPDVPLFYVIVGSLLVGLAMSYAIYLIETISTMFTLRGKEKQLKRNKDEVLELTKKIHQLELENEKLKHGSHTEPVDPNAL